MVIVEESTNYPTILGRKNIPKKLQWGAGRLIETLPSVIAAGMDRSFLPQFFKQLPRRGTGLGLGRARTGLARGRGIPLGPLERLKRHEEITGEALSLDVDSHTQLHNAVHAQTEKNIPRPWGPREWYPGALVQNLPSVIQTGAGVSGPTRTMHPKMIPTGLSVEI